MTTSLAICCLVLVYMCVQANCATDMELSNLAKEYEIETFSEAWDQNSGNHLQGSGKCARNQDEIRCCVSQRFNVNLLFKKIRFNINACINVANAGSDAILFTFTMSGRRLVHKTISLRNPPSLCYKVPGLSGLAKVCVHFYSINLAEKRMCARLSGIIDLKVKKYHVNLKFGCFKLPTGDDEMMTFLSEGNLLPIGELEPFIDDAEMELSDMD